MLVEKIDSIIRTLELMKRDAEKAQNGVFTAGIRVRKDAFAILKEVKEIRTMVMDIRKEKKKND